MPSKSKVCFFFEVTNFHFEKRNQLKTFIHAIIKNEKKKIGGINCVFCSDETLLKINRKYLKHNYYTDIITFDLSDSELVFADIYISIDRVKENAKNIGVSFKSELHRVIIHGVLHLCGYNDKKPWEKRKMRGREDYFLAKYFC